MRLKVLFDEVRPLFPQGRLAQTQVDGIRDILAAVKTIPLTHQAYSFATAQWETAHTMQPIHERGAISYFNKYEPGTRIGRNLGNTEKGDGFRFRGRGYVQLTGRENYAKATRKLGVDLLAEPDLALRADIAASIMVVGMREGWFTGRKLSDYLPGDYRNARRIINGTDKAYEIAGLATSWEAALRGAQ